MKLDGMNTVVFDPEKEMLTVGHVYFDYDYRVAVVYRPDGSVWRITIVYRYKYSEDDNGIVTLNKG